MLDRVPYTEVKDPDYIELLTYSELDALFELHGHLRAANPANQVHLRIAGQLKSDDYTSHVVSLGGVDWNSATSSALQSLQLPVRQVADWSTPDGQYFEVEVNGKSVKHRAVLDMSRAPGAARQPGDETAGKGILREDVALFARAVSPYNRKRTVTICSGMYGRGTYGAVRALTDERFRDRKAAGCPAVQANSAEVTGHYRHHGDDRECLGCHHGNRQNQAEGERPDPRRPEFPQPALTHSASFRCPPA